MVLNGLLPGRSFSRLLSMRGLRFSYSTSGSIQAVPNTFMQFETFQPPKQVFDTCVSVSPANPEKYCVLLKEIPIKAPTSKILEFENEHLAHLLALEWNASN